MNESFSTLILKSLAQKSCAKNMIEQKHWLLKTQTLTVWATKAWPDRPQPILTKIFGVYCAHCMGKCVYQGKGEHRGSFLKHDPRWLHNFCLVQWSLLGFILMLLLWNEHLSKNNSLSRGIAGTMGKTHLTPPCPHGCDIPTCCMSRFAGPVRWGVGALLSWSQLLWSMQLLICSSQNSVAKHTALHHMQIRGLFLEIKTDTFAPVLWNTWVIN